MKRKIRYLLILLAMSGAAFSLSYARFPGHGPGGGDLPIGKLLHDPEFIEKLHLTPDQIAELKNLHFEHQKKMITLRSHLEMKKLELRKLMDAENWNKNLIRKKVQELSALKGDLALEKMEMKLSAADVLTPEQKAQLKRMRCEFRKQRMSKRMEMEGPGRHEGCRGRHKHSPPWREWPEEEEKEIGMEEE